MSCAIILQGPIESGKTKTCLELVERARAEGVSTGGVVSPRMFIDGRLVGYDGLEPASGEVYPLARLRERAEGQGWFSHGGMIYLFSAPGFERANEALRLSVEDPGRPMLIFVDEFGRLEDAGLGLYPGALSVTGALKGGVVSVYTCRTNLVSTVESLLQGKAEETHVVKPGDADALWGLICERLWS
jgi:hypothetical protein